MSNYDHIDVISWVRSPVQLVYVRYLRWFGWRETVPARRSPRVTCVPDWTVEYRVTCPFFGVTAQHHHTWLETENDSELGPTTSIRYVAEQLASAQCQAMLRQLRDLNDDRFLVPETFGAATVPGPANAEAVTFVMTDTVTELELDKMSEGEWRKAGRPGPRGCRS